MTAIDFDDLVRHYGHDVNVVTYGRSSGKDADNVAVECETCGEVLFDYDKEESK
jgi:hypothetical protein